MASQPWVSRAFLKDSKLRTTERYWRDVKDLQLDEHETPVVALILADAATWRKYLRLIRCIVEYEHVPLQWIFLESAAELMDYRNQSVREAAAPQERSTLQRMIERNGNVEAFTDLSVRTENDEWDLLGYEKLSIVERSRQALLRAAHLLGDGASTPCWLVVADRSRLPLDEGDNMKYMEMEEIVEFLTDCLTVEQVERLRELQRSCEDEYERRNITPRTEDDGDVEVILSEEEIRKKLKTGQLLRGRLNVTKENTKEAYVTAAGKTFFIAYEHLDHAFHQDMVLVEPLPEAKWGRPIGRRRLVHHGEEQDEITESSVPAVPSARVVAVDQPTRRTFVATMTDLPNPDESVVLVIPMDMRVPKIRIRTRSWSKFTNVRLKVEVDGWESGSNYPHGRCVEILGPVGDLETEIQALLIENQVKLDPFSTEALACLPVEGAAWKVTEAEISRRKDLRHSRRIFSVDPPGCQDIDDTMHAEVLPNGDIEVGVHIADVTAFVNSQLDKEAQLRGTTFYLVDRRFDMLPSLLSSDLCSLHGGVDRLAVSVIWTLSADLSEVKSTWYGRTVIHNCAAMTYDQADNILHNKAPDEPGKPRPPPLTAGSPVDPDLIGSLKQDLSILTLLARKLRKDREEIGGAVDLSNDSSGSELKFTLESGTPTKVVPKEDKEIHHTIAELMIMANTAVAMRIHDAMPDSALLRIHRSLEESSFDELREILEAAGVRLDGNSSTTLAKSLKEAQRKGRAENSPFQSLLLHVATRAMTEAQYICTGDREEGTDLSHFGLGIQKYTHFTSPIRRYADVIVHKQLLSSLSENLADQRAATVKLAKVDPLKAIPDSNVVSILAGEGLDDEAEDEIEEDLIDTLIEGASGLVLGQDEQAMLVDAPDENKRMGLPVKPYGKSEVTAICEGLNRHNRLAKHSSFECQSLFLSLYFKNHTSKTQAVVTNVRENGFWAYVPKFDLRGPVYVRDTNGDVQIDPALVGLPQDSGLAPTLGFTASGSCRRYPDGRCELYGDPDDRLEVRVGATAKAFVVRPFDVVDIELTCDNWDVRARVPPPRLQLVSSRTSAASTKNRSTTPVDITSEKLEQASARKDVLSGTSDVPTESPSLFDSLSTLDIRPVLHEVPLRCQLTKPQIPDREEMLRGRVVYGGFINPDTRSAAQEVAQQAAATDAAQRRAKLAQASSRRGEYDTSRAIERNITMRQQRLAADKRHTRRSKAK